MNYINVEQDSMMHDTQAVCAEEHKPTKYTVILLGEFGVGKSSLFRRLDKGDFVEFVPRATLSMTHCDFKPRNIENVLIEVHDTGGMERLGSLTKNYFNMAQGVVIMYDVTQISSIDHIIRWNNEVMHYVPDTTVMLLGNRKDQLDGSVDNTFTDNHAKASAMASNYGFAIHRTISCKTGEGVLEAFEELAQVIHSKNIKEDKDIIVLEEPPTTRKKFSC